MKAEIRAQDLRIGNWVIDGNGKHIQVLSIDKNNINEPPFGVDYNYHWGYDDIQGIPLTPEILEKCGFEDQKAIFVNKHGLTLGAKYNKDRTAYFMTKGSVVEIKYLNQLQNLYFCLCGEELKVNL